MRASHLLELEIQSRVPTLLSLPLQLLGMIAMLLVPSDRAQFVSTCRTLHTAGYDWFRAVVVRTIDWTPLHHMTLSKWHAYGVQAYLVLVFPEHADGPDVTSFAAVRGILDFPHFSSVALSFNGYRKEQLPLSLFEHQSMLTSLMLDHHELDNDWGALAQLSNLRELHVHTSNGKHLPRVLADMPNLTTLNLTFGDVSEASLQRVLPRLPGLRRLRLHMCNLNAVPPHITALTGVTSLILTDNCFEDVAVEGGGMRHLGAMTQLRNLIVNNTYLAANDFEALSSLTNLTSLNISHVDIDREEYDFAIDHAVPAFLRELTALEVLDLSGMTLNSQWSNLGPAKKLRELCLDECGLTEIPREFKGFTALERLSMADCAVRRGWRTLIDLPNLQYLACARRTVPTEVRRKVRKIEYISLVNNDASDPEEDYLSDVSNGL